MKIYGVKWTIPIRSVDLDDGNGRRYFSTPEAQTEFYEQLAAALRLLNLPQSPYLAAWAEEVYS